MLKRSLKFHQNIYQAIKDRSRSKAISQMEKHISDVQRAIQEYYRNQDQSGGERGKAIARRDTLLKDAPRD
jgi:DNA-binding FadR family transcriptional regulator